MHLTDYVHPDPVFADLETCSLVDLPRRGGRAYASDDSTRILCGGFMRGERRTVWVDTRSCPLTERLPDQVEGFEVHRGPMPPGWVLEAVQNGAPLCGHNAHEFDRLVWDALVGVPAAWRDTMLLCRAAALPGSLEGACELLFGLKKDPRGRVLEVLSRARLVGGRPQYPVGTAGAWVNLLAYCCADVRLLARLHAEVIGYAEPAVLEADAQVNERGIPVDHRFAARLVLLQDELSMASAAEASALTEEDLEVRDVHSAAKVKRWMESVGVPVPTRDGVATLDRREVRRLLEDPEAFLGESEEACELVAKVLRLRQEVVRVTTGKALRMIEESPDGWARGQHAYHRAHTGRWSGRRLQPHNFPRGVDGVDPALARDDLTLAEVVAEAARLSAPGAVVTPGDVLGSLLRPVVATDAPLAIGDLAQVEARGVCWLFGEEGALETFRDPTRDYYVEFARRLYGTTVVTKAQRWNAKQSGLGAGYGMSGRKMTAMLDAQGVDSSAGAAIISTYRREHPRVVAGWRALEAAAIAAMEGGPQTVGRVRFEGGDNLVVTLPSGRRITYRDARVEPVVPAYCAMYGLPAEPKPTLTYRHPYGWRGQQYGGRWCLGPETLVLTQRGSMRIVEVTKTDLVWDGVEWVQTGGCIYNGEKEVESWLGVLVTGDHLIFDGIKWCTVTALDDAATQQCLRWAASSAPWKYSKSQTMQSIQRSDADACNAAWSTSCTRYTFYASNGRVVLVVRRSTEGLSLKTSCSCRDSSVASSRPDVSWPCGASCCTDAIRIPTTRLGTTMGDVASGCATNGPRTSRPSLPTYVSRRDRSMRTIDVEHGTSCSMENGCCCKTFATRTAWTCREAPSGTGLNSDGPRNGSWKSVGKSSVYDLLDCGSRHRFTVLTDAGPLVVHNCENVCQGMCRDLLADDLVRADAAGLRPSVHSHDEIVCLEGNVDALGALMSEPPAWADGFPLAVETFSAARYYKKAPHGEAKFLLGRKTK